MHETEPTPLELRRLVSGERIHRLRRRQQVLFAALALGTLAYFGAVAASGPAEPSPGAFGLLAAPLVILALLAGRVAGMVEVTDAFRTGLQREQIDPGLEHSYDLPRRVHDHLIHRYRPTEASLAGSPRLRAARFPPREPQGD